LEKQVIELPPRKTQIAIGTEAGFRHPNDGIWLLNFMHYDLGYIDLEQRTLQTIDNPFGTRLSPMS
jgi:hypothetical protein